LDQAFETLKDLLTYAIPLEIMAIFAGFAPLYLDVSMMSAMVRKASVDPLSYGNVC
jgi:hypothetical protein